MSIPAYNYSVQEQANDDMRAWLEQQDLDTVTDRVISDKAREIAAQYAEDDPTRNRYTNGIAAYAYEWVEEVQKNTELNSYGY